MRVPTSVSKKIRILKQLEPRTPTKCMQASSSKVANDKLHENFKKISSISPIPTAPISPKVKALTPKSFEMMPNSTKAQSDLIHSKKSLKAKSFISNRKHKEPSNRNKSSLGYYNDNTGILNTGNNDSIGYIPENKYLNYLGSHSSTVILDKKPFGSIKNLSDLKYFLNRSKMPNPEIKSSIFQKYSHETSFLPRIKKKYEHKRID
ncbi:hypothetical protein SteCoe_8432 [Stentor coeruleus]|uniref:Uncharacterized protein n=1 Tax=Stentor coeruleus TaxID=5963 RepID=A0A1R2CK72_9CILI|nr:hypothetical protein SteCoe_8432 [Stentor coeruleus]